MSGYARYDFPTAVFNRTFKAVQFHVVRNSADLDLAGASITIEIESKKQRNKKFIWSTSNGLVSIIDAAGGVFRINEINLLNLPVDEYGYGVVIHLSDGTIFEWVYGNLTVIDLTPNGR